MNIEIEHNRNNISLKEANLKADYITFLSVISSLAVVILHTNGAFWKFNATARSWFTANIIESVFYFAVPIFFMISGITLIDYNKRYSLKEYYKKRVKKTMLPFLFWSIVGMIFQMHLKHILFSTLSLDSVINGILKSSYIGIFWFFIPLFCCYMIIPVFSAIGDKKRVFQYILFLMILLNSLIPFLINVMHLPIKWNLTFPIGGHSIYILLGYCLDKIHLSKKQQHVIYTMAIIGLLMHIVGTYHLSIAAGKIIRTYKGYLNIPCIAYSTGVFVFLKENSKVLSSNIRKAIDYLKRYSFASYLLQLFFLFLLPKWLHINVLSIYWRLGGIFLILPLTILCTKAIRLLPFGKIILP